MSIFQNFLKHNALLSSLLNSVNVCNMSSLFKLSYSVKYGNRKFFPFPVLLSQSILRNAKLGNYSDATWLLPGDVFPRHRSFNIYSTRCQNPQLPSSIESASKQGFEIMFPKIIKSLRKHFPAAEHIGDIAAWFEEVAYYNVLGGKKSRGMILVNAYNSLSSGNADDSLHQKAYVLAWCLEMLQAFLVIVDDIMDQSETRRGKLCWYKKEEVGLTAINDAFLLETAVYKILHDNFGGTVCYEQIVKEFRETTLKTLIGQCMDSRSFSQGKPNWNLFTPERYAAIVKYKTTWYTFFLPINLAFILMSAGDHERKLSYSGCRPLEEELLLKIGHYFQVQDDYIDCFGNPNITGKHGSDIQDGKCSWLILEALRVAEPATKKTLQEKYGKKNEDEVKIVKEIYKSLNIPESYARFEKNIHQEICMMIKKNYADNDVHKSVFLNIVEKLYHRNK